MQAAELPAVNDSEGLNLRNGVIVILSGGPVDLTNPPEVRSRMHQLIAEINADPQIQTSTGGKGLAYRLLEGQKTDHIHQSLWEELCTNEQVLSASPLIIVGHSNGGAAAMNLARFLELRRRSVDFLFTADSVLTLNDNGDPYKVPANVKFNINSYSIPVFPIWLTLPFPFGKKNQRQDEGSLEGILNIGLRFEEPGAIEHRDVFYKLAGGDESAQGYAYPNLIRDSILGLLKGSDQSQVSAEAKTYLQTLANEERIQIHLETTNTSETLIPSGATDGTEDRSREGCAALEELHKQLSQLERTRLTLA